ncbi:MAG: polysaccharide biosynthesis/export family protein [Candidatus Azotimanducaceae bacterium]
MPGGYQIGPGDSLYLQVFGKDSIDVEIEVDQEGRLVIPRLGPLQIAGLTYNDASVLIKQRVKERMLGSEVVVSMGALRKISVFLAGEVKAPGNYNISALTKVSQALYLSGGITEIGSYREIQVKRAGKTVRTFDLYDLLLAG